MPAPRDPGGRFLPARETLERRSIPDLVSTLQRFGMPVDLEHLMGVAERATARIIAADNPTPRMIQQQIDAITSAMQRELAVTAKNAVRDMELKALGLKGKGAFSRMAVWVAVMDTGTCEDCEDRHGEEASMREWNGRGLPGSGNTVCNGRCRCYLAPAEMFAGEDDEDESEAA